jgi:glycosyltransferase involved in cell wall biosynthesis
LLEFYSKLKLNQISSGQPNSVLAGKSGIRTGEKIRVVRIAHASLTPALRGRERAIVRSFPNVDMQVITPPRWKETGVDVETVPDEYFPVIKAGTFLSKHIQLFAYNPFPIIRAFRKHQPHIIDMDHEPYSVPCAEILTLRNMFAPQAKIVMQTAQNILKRYPPPFSFLEKRALKQVSAAYMCSETVREVLETKHFTNPTVLAPFGIDSDLFFPREKTEKSKDRPFTIGYVGRLMPAKGLLVLIEALTKIKSKNWRFLVVGDGGQKDLMREKLAFHGLLERCEFVGAVPYEETPEYFHKMDVLIVPTRTTKKIREQFGRVIIEAMACEIPVIGSTCGAIPEVIADAGLIFPESDSGQLANQMLRIIEDEDLQKKLATAGRKRVLENYTWNHAASQIYSAYLKVLDKRENQGERK